MNIDITLIDRQFIPYSEKERNQSKKVSKICIYDFFSVNEVKICEKIKEIPYYSNDFYIVEQCNFIKIGEMSKKSVQILQNINKTDDIDTNENRNEKTKEKYVLLQYKKKKSIDSIPFEKWLFSFSRPKTFIFHVLSSYSSLLQTFITLHENDICFFDLSTKNIFFKQNNNPFLENFGHSLLRNKLDESYISKIITKINDYTCKPLEVYVLFYLIVNNEETLSYHFIETIVSFFIDNMNVLTLFTENYRETYKQQCIDVLKIYINRPKSEIIRGLLTNCETWDNYSLSILYLHMIGTIIRVFSLKEGFMFSFLKLLTQNISPNPSKRESLKNTQYHYEKLFHTFTEWGFIKELELSHNKMKLLYELL